MPRVANDGKQLETLVQQVEELLLPQGFAVTPRRRVFDEDGVPIAELDIEITGRIGTADMRSLIECRDREQPGSAAWIEQLVGRRDRFRLNKVMAVSTAGFTPGAVAYAKDSGIELRTVADIDVAQLPHWLGMREMTFATTAFVLDKALVGLSPDEAPERAEATRRCLKAAAAAASDAKPLRPINGAENRSLADAFAGAFSHRQDLLVDLQPNGEAKHLAINVRYTNDADHFVIDTEFGPVRIRDIHFEGQVRLKEARIPIGELKEYRREGPSETIAQTVSFPVEVQGSKYSIEMHNLADTGETHVLLRKLS